MSNKLSGKQRQEIKTSKLKAKDLAKAYGVSLAYIYLLKSSNKRASNG